MCVFLCVMFAVSVLRLAKSVLSVSLTCAAVLMAGGVCVREGMVHGHMCVRYHSSSCVKCAGVSRYRPHVTLM